MGGGTTMGNAKYTATRMTVSIGAAALVVMAMVVPVPVPASTVSPAVRLSADSTALIMGGTTIPTPDDYMVEIIKNQYIAPTHPGQDIDYVAVTTPEEFWPLTGFWRLLFSAVGPPEIWGPGSAAWPDEPWWKLSGLFDLTFDKSVQAGVADLEAAIAEHGNDHLVIYGYSQGAIIANLEKRTLAEQYPAGTDAPDIDFVLQGDPNLPNGGLWARLTGLYIPIIDLSFNGPAPTDTQFDTVEINRQYDGAADFPLYPINVIADLNAVLGLFYVHAYEFDVSLAPDPSTSLAYQGTHGDTSYYFFPTQDLPLFAPLRTLGVPESLIDVVEPFFRVLVELGYDRSIPPWEPTPARLIPIFDPATVTADLVNAIGEGISNALALIGLPPPVSIPVPVTTATPKPPDAHTATEPVKADVSPQMTPPETVTETGQAKTGTGVSLQVTVTEAVSKTGQATSTKTKTEAHQAASRPTPTRTNPATASAAGASELSTRATPNPSVSASTPKPAKPAGQPATPRPVVRGSLGVGEQLRDLPHRGNGGRHTTRISAAGDGAATAGPSSVASSSAASSSTGSNSSGGDSSGGDAGGS
jgi:hypothetical protein